VGPLVLGKGFFWETFVFLNFSRGKFFYEKKKKLFFLKFKSPKNFLIPKFFLSQNKLPLKKIIKKNKLKTPPQIFLNWNFSFFFSPLQKLKTPKKKKNPKKKRKIPPENREKNPIWAPLFFAIKKN